MQGLLVLLTPNHYRYLTPRKTIICFLLLNNMNIGEEDTEWGYGKLENNQIFKLTAYQTFIIDLYIILIIE